MRVRPRPLSHAGAHISQLPRRPQDCDQQAAAAPWDAGWPKPQTLASLGARAEMPACDVSRFWWASSLAFSIAGTSVRWRAVFSAQEEGVALRRRRGNQGKGREVQLER